MTSKRRIGAVVATAVLVALGFGVDARADVSDNCFDDNNPSEVGLTLGAVGGVGFESGYDADNNADFQHVCYRVYEPGTGNTLVGGIVKPYQYRYGLPGLAGGVQCVADASSVHPTPFCYVVYGVFPSVSPSGVALSGWAGETGTSHVLVEFTNVSVTGTGSVTPTDTATTLGVSATTPNACAILNGTIGTCTGTLPLGASVTKNEVTPRSPLGVPTGVDPDSNPGAPLAAVTVGSTTIPVEVPASCIGIC